MFARVSTYKAGPDPPPTAPTDEIVQRVLAVPGCHGIYYLEDAASGSHHLWPNLEPRTANLDARPEG
ncbi:MAG: hypothetical protein ABIX44_04835 [Cryobacterium sp.]